MSKLLCFAHRGSSGHRPENTLLAIRTALYQQADYVEIDVYKVENRLLVFHDERLERTTNGMGYLVSHPLHYLRTLNAGDGEKIPFLEEVIDTVGHQAGINIELKGVGCASAVAEVLTNYLQQGWNPDEFLVSSFNHHQLQEFKTMLPEVPIGVLIGSLPLHYAELAGELDAYSIHCSLEFVDRKMVEDAHRRGVKVFVYTVNYQEDLTRMIALGVDGVFTNYPELVTGVPPDRK